MFEMVDEVTVNVDGPSGGDLMNGLFQGVRDSFNGLIDRVKDGSNEFFMTATIGIMLTAGTVYIWRRL